MAALTSLWVLLLALQTAGNLQPGSGPLQGVFESRLMARVAGQPDLRGMALSMTDDPALRAWLNGRTVPEHLLPQGLSQEGRWRVLALGGMLGFNALAGVVTWLAWLVPRPGAPPEGPEAPPLEHAWVLFVVWQLLYGLLAPVVAHELRPLGPIPSTAVTTLGFYFAGLWLLRPLLPRVSLHAERAAAALPTFWAAGPAVLLASLLTGWMLGGSPASRNAALGLFLDAGSAGLVQLALLVVVAGPIFEEVLFRGVLFGALRGRMGPVPAALVSSVAFASVHADPAGFLPYMALGLLFTRVYQRTRSLAACCLAHALWNAQTFLMIALVL
ncbi:MAG: type II CAAX endopeptidase family protein [Candidatus Eremiobacterota bacterium]